MRARRWLLIPISAGAAVAIWSGWVGLGQLCGFGVVNLLPGIAGGFRLNTAITLPVGAEAYAAFALGVWISGKGDERARAFARWSALGALAYGMLGQVVYHLLAAAHVTAAPWPIVVMVSCMPVVVLGFAAALTHLLRGSEDVAGEAAPESPSASPATTPGTVPSSSFEAAKAGLAATHAAGNPFSKNKLRAQFRITRTEADELWAPYESPPAGDALSAQRMASAPGGVNGHGAADG